MGKEKLRIRLIANAGLFVESSRDRFLIDAIHHEPDHPFSVVRKEFLEEILHGHGEYRDVDYLLYTHCHSDHFTEKYTKEYLKHHQVQGVFLPEACLGAGLFQDRTRNELKVFALKDSRLGRLISYEIHKDLTIHVFRTTHLGEDYQGEIHYSYVLSIGSMNILITGDASYEEEEFRKALEGLSIDTMITTPLFYHHNVGRQIMEEVIKPQIVLIYHIPFKEDDIYKMRKLTMRDIEKHKALHLTVIALMEENQTIDLVKQIRAE